jgi:ribonuclease HII
MRVMGLDEAGRGAVLGPMTVGAFVVDDSLYAELTSIGVTDSKKLSPKKRTLIAALLPELGTGDVRLLSAREIDAGNLNHLEEEVFIDLIETHQPDHVIIDAPTHPRGIPALIHRMKSRLSYSPTLCVEPKADLNYLPVGAASILAKVRRDAIIASLGEIGSGYPSDPTTRSFLIEALRTEAPLPDFVRTRWATIDNLRQRPIVDPRAAARG